MAMIKCPECRKSISSEATACPKCGKPISEATKKKALERARQPPYLAILVVVTITIVLLVFAALPSNKSATSQSGCNDSSDSKSSAQTVAELSVKRELKAPSSAKFGDSRVSYTGECKFLVVGEVDAQNSFGAMLRKTYTVRVEYRPGERNWEAVSVELVP